MSAREGANHQLYEKALDVASQQSQEMMDKIQQQKNNIQSSSLTKGISKQKSFASKSSVNFSDEIISSSEVPKRSNSAPRMMPAARAAMASSLAAANSNIWSQSSSCASASNASPSMEGVVSSNLNVNIIRKFQLLEERIRKLDKAQASTDVSVHDISMKLDQLADTQKQEKKLYHSLKEQLASTRTRMDLLSTQDELRNKNSQPPSNLPFGLDGEMLQDLINRKVQRAVEDALIQQRLLLQPTSSDELDPPNSRSLISSTQPPAIPFQSTSTYDNLASSSSSAHRAASKQEPPVTSQPQQRYVFDSLATAEREILRLSSEIDRIKTKQTYLDRVYTEIKDASTVREGKRDESHRKQLYQFRIEIDQIIENSTQKVNNLTTLRETQGEELKSLQQAIDQHIDNMGSVLAEIDVRILDSENHMQNVANAQTVMQTKTLKLQDQLTDLEETLPKLFVQEMETQLGSVQQSLQMLSQQQELQHEKIVEVSLLNHQLTEQLDGLVVGPVSLLSASVDSLKEKFESDVQLLRNQMNQENRTTDDNLKLFTDNFKKWKARIKELHGKQSKLESKQEEIDRLAALLEQQREEDAKTTYEWHTKLQRLEENQASMVQKHSKHIQDVSAMVDSSLQDIEQTLKMSMEAQSHAQEMFQARVMERSASEVEIRVPEVMSRLLEQSPWQDFTVRLTEQEETQQTLLQELKEFHQSMNELVTRQKQFFQQRLQEDEAARSIALYQLQENWNQTHHDSLVALKDSLLSEVGEFQDKTVAKMVEISKENIHLWQETFQDWETQLSNLTSTVHLVESNVSAITQRHCILEDEARIRKEREEAQEKLKRLEDEKHEEERKQLQEQQKHVEANTSFPYLASPLAHLHSSSADAFTVPDVSSLQEFHALMERVQSDIQALDHHRMDTSWTPKTSPIPSNFTVITKDKDSDEEEHKKKSSKKPHKRRKSSKKSKKKSSSRKHRHKKHYSSSDDDDDDEDSSSSSSSSSEEEEIGEKNDTVSPLKRDKRKPLLSESHRLSSSGKLSASSSVLLSDREASNAQIQRSSQVNHRDSRDHTAMDKKSAPDVTAASGSKTGMSRDQRVPAYNDSQNHSRYNAKTVNLADEEEEVEAEVEYLTAEDIEAEQAALDDWDHIEFASASLVDLAGTSNSSSQRISVADFAPLTSASASAPTSASKEQQTSPILEEEGETGELASVESELTDSDFDPQRIMQLVLEKRRTLRSQLRPELFGTASSQLLHHLPVTPHEHVLSTSFSRFSVSQNMSGSNSISSTSRQEFDKQMRPEAKSGSSREQLSTTFDKAISKAPTTLLDASITTITAAEPEPPAAVVTNAATNPELMSFEEDDEKDRFMSNAVGLSDSENSA